MAVIRKQYRNFKIRITRTENGLFRYSVKDTDIKDVATSVDEAICLAMEDIENHIDTMSTK